MSDTTFERVMDVLGAARELRGQERERVLDATCGDDDKLRTEVLSLLSQADTEDDADEELLPGFDADAMRQLLPDATNALERVTRAASDHMQAPTPDTLGPFRIVRRIATGGMGTVYEAAQSNPARRVALKTMRSDLLTSSLLSRFQREAEILGRLQHPGIGQIFEAGTVEHLGTTLPYFAMEFVDGKPLGAYAADESLDEPGRLKLFAQICDAVHYAHTQGVVHRDLKPDNILVTAEGRPKVLDFGVARITGSDIQAQTLVTEVGQIMGTLPYMSPEQVAGNPGDIDARCDVYALGVVLFELLSGRRPHELAGKTLPDAARIIREKEATRLGSVASRWRGDLDTIVGKAIDKDSARRYTGAHELAADVRRHLSDQPIAARAPSRLYLVRKFAQRHRGLVVGTSVAVLALVAGLGFSLSFAFDEAQQRRMADASAYQARISAAMAALDDQEHLVGRALLDKAPVALRSWEWHHAAARAEPLLWELPLDLSPPAFWEHIVPTVAFSPDGRLLAALVADDRVDVFVAETGARQHSIQLSGPLNINCLAATAAGFVTVTVQGHVAHWDGPTGELHQQQLVPGLKVSELSNYNRMAWDETSGRLAVIAHRRQDSRSVSGVSRYEKSLFLGPIGSLQLVDTGSTNHFPVAWTDDGQALVSYSHPELSLGAMVSDVVMDELGPPTLRLRSRVAATHTYDGHGDRLLVVPEGGVTDKLVVVDLEGRELVRLDPQLQANVTNGAFSEDGRRIVTTTSGASRIVTVFDAASGRALTRWPSSGGAFGAVSPTGKLLAIGSPDRLSVFSLDSPATTMLPGANDYVYGLAWAPDGRTLWARNFDMSLRGYDVVEGAVVLDVPAPRGQSGNWAYQDATWGISADGRRLVATHHFLRGEPLMRLSTHDVVWDGHWREVPGVGWDAPPGETVRDFLQLPRASRLEFLRATGAIGPSERPPRDLAVTRAGGSDPRVRSDPAGQLLVGPLAMHVEHVDGSGHVPLLIKGRGLPIDEGILRQSGSPIPHADASFSPDGTLLAAVRPGVHDGVVVHDVSTGDSVVELLTGLETEVLFYAVAFSPDGRRLAAAGTDRVVSLFDTASWQLVTRLEGHRGYIKDIAWSPDGATLATASGDGTVRLWHTTSRTDRVAAAHAAVARRERQRPSVAALFAVLDDPQAVADAIRADASLDDDQRHAAIRVVRELADAWWAGREDGPGHR